MRIIRDGERHTRLFFDKKDGGEEAAYEKALAHRNEKLDELPDLPENGPIQTDEVHRRRWETMTRAGVKEIGLPNPSRSWLEFSKAPSQRIRAWPQASPWFGFLDMSRRDRSPPA